MVDPKGRVTINISPELKAVVTKRAKSLRRSVSAHLARLIERDLGMQVEEERASYISGKAKPSGETGHSPPDEPKHHRGDGPRLAVP